MASLPLQHDTSRDCQTAPVLGGEADGMSLVEWRDFADGAALAEWDALALNASEPNPFFESWNLLPALTNLDAGRAVRIALFRSGGKLTGLMPLVRSALYYGYPLPHWHNWLHHNCFCGLPLVAKSHEAEFWSALLQTMDARPGGAFFLHLTHLPAGGPVHAALADTLDRQPRPFAVVHSEQRALLQSSKSPADYFAASMNGKKRKELRRQHSRLSELGSLKFCRDLDDQGIDQWCEDFLDLELAGWKGREGSALACDPGTASFFRSALHGGAARGRAERLSLSLDGRPIAMLVNFLAPPGSYSFKTAFDETYAQYSPGVLLQRENLDLLDQQGIDWCDSCASADHPMIERIWRQKRTIQRVSIGIGGALRQSFVRQLLRAESGRKAATL